MSNPVVTLAVTPIVGAVIEAYALPTEIGVKVRAQGVELSKADVSFETALDKVSTALAHLIGTSPAFDHWEAVAGAFQIAYVNDRKCTAETARKRWGAVTAEMDRQFSLEKPSKPTKAAEVKAEQRKGAAAEAAALIAKAGATTPAAVLALSQAGVSTPVIKALAAEAGKLASDAGKAANEAAKAAAATMREEIRKSLAGLTNAQLDKVRRLVQSFTVPPAAVISPAAAAVGLETLVADPATAPF